MLVDALALCSIGVIAMLLPATAPYARYLVRRVASRADAVVPAEQAPALQARARRRARAVGVGILAAGLIWLVVTLLWPGEQPSGGYVVVSLLVVSGAALDAAASTAAVASGQVGPAWSIGLLIGGYLLPFLLIIGALAVAVARGGGDDMHFQRRLWPAGGPVDAGRGAS